MSGQPPPAWLALARWLVAPRQREEVEGDLIELWARVTDDDRRSPALSFWYEALSLAIASRRRMPATSMAPQGRRTGGLRIAMFHELAQDARYALRFLRRAPGFSLATISLLTLGIGVVTGAYTVVNGFLRPWPVRNANDVVIASAERRQQPAAGRIDDGFSYGAFEHIRTNARAADYVAMERYYLSTAAQRGERTPGRVPEAMFVSDQFVEVIDVRLQQGTGLTHAPASGPKVLLSDALWRSRFNGEPGIVGRTIWLTAREHPATVVGVMAPAFNSLGAVRLDLVVDLPSITTLGRSVKLLTEPTSCCLDIAGRLRPGWTLEQALAELQLLTAAYRQSIAQPELTVRLRNTTPDGELGDSARLAIGLIGGGLLLIFVLTCANVGNMYLARSLARRPEIAVRLSLGATRARVVRQLLTEGLMMAAFAGAGAFLVARSVPRLAAWFDEAPPGIFVPDWRVAAVTIGAVVVACLLVALTPALHTTRIAWRGATVMMSAPAGRMRGGLLAVQIAIAAVLMLSTTLLVRGILHAASAPTDYALHSTTVGKVQLPAGRKYDQQVVTNMVRATEANAVSVGVAVTVHESTLEWGRTSVMLSSGAQFYPGLLSMNRAALDVLQVSLALAAGHPTRPKPAKRWSTRRSRAACHRTPACWEHHSRSANGGATSSSASCATRT